MLNNVALNNPNTHDEWHTPYQVVASELSHYVSQLYGKSVLCNCNDGYSSGFTQYFLRNFNELHLKRLVAISNTQVLCVDKVLNITESSTKDIVTIQGQIQTVSSGDFRNTTEFLQNCDVVITNPPFSLFKELFHLVMAYKKQFLFIGTINHLTYKNIFPYVKRGEIRVGYSTKFTFLVPVNLETPNGEKKLSRLGNAVWITNLQVRDKPFISLTEKYSPDQYPVYDTAPTVIHVDKVVNIPKDYEGVMGVSCNFLSKWNPKQFEIIGEANHGKDNEYDFFDPILKGKQKFKRILIKHC